MSGNQDHLDAALLAKATKSEDYEVGDLIGEGWEVSAKSPGYESGYFAYVFKKVDPTTREFVYNFTSRGFDGTGGDVDTSLDILNGNLPETALRDGFKFYNQFVFAERIQDTSKITFSGEKDGAFISQAIATASGGKAIGVNSSAFISSNHLSTLVDIAESEGLSIGRNEVLNGDYNARIINIRSKVSESNFVEGESLGSEAVYASQ